MRLLRLTLLAVTLLVLLARMAGATTWYISPTGNNANPGTQEAPLKTFKAGVAKLTQDGDELVLKPGQYNGEGIVMVERPGAADYVTIRAEVPGTAKVWGRLTMWGLQVASYTKLQGIWFSGNPSVFSRETQTDLHHIWVEDCQFKSTEESIAATGSRCGWPLSLPWCKYVTVRNCLFQECIKFAALGSKLGPTVYHVQVEKCTFAHNWCESDTNVDGIVIDGPDHAADLVQRHDVGLRGQEGLLVGAGLRRRHLRRLRPPPALRRARSRQRRVSAAKAVRPSSSAPAIPSKHCRAATTFPPLRSCRPMATGGRARCRPASN